MKGKGVWPRFAEVSWFLKFDFSSNPISDRETGKGGARAADQAYVKAGPWEILQPAQLFQF